MWNYKAELVRVIDGDTVVLKLEKEFSFPIDFGFYIQEEFKTIKTVELSFRIAGINSPEMHGDRKEAGQLAKSEMERILNSGELEVTTYKPDKYGRWLVSIFVKSPDGAVINAGDEMIKNGFAVPYMVLKS